jgi:alpha-L-fucosidase 2
MVWGDGNPLAFTLDKADLWDLRSNTDYMRDPGYNYASLRRLMNEQRYAEVAEIFEERIRRDNPVGPTKISIGRAILPLGGTSGYAGRLELRGSTASAAIGTQAQKHRVTAFVHRSRNALCVRCEPCPGGRLLNVVPLADLNEDLARLQHPKPQREEDGELSILVQHIPPDLWYAVAWNPTGPDFFLCVETGGSFDAARSKAMDTWRWAHKTGFARLLEEHEQGWAKFWSASAVRLPEARLEFLWYYGLYLLASSARRGSPPPGLQGLWAMDGVMPPWRGEYGTDMNVQETFWPACASGHLELLDSWCDLMQDCADAAHSFTQRFFGTEGTFWLCSFLPRYAVFPGWAPVQFAWSNSGWLAWLVWLRWRYSMDVAWLADVGYPLVSEVFRFYAANLEEEEDGFLHVPLSGSPEYADNRPEAWHEDPNIDLALIRRCCDWVVEMGDALGTSELRSEALRVRERLVPYALTPQKELCLWPGKALDESHRHPSHLMAIHPAMDLTVDGPDDARAIMDASVAQYLSLGQYLWAGHSYAQLISLAAVIGRGDWAYENLRCFADHWIGPNGLHFNRYLGEAGRSAFKPETGEAAPGPFTMEASCAVSAGISDMLVQGWNDIVRVFPAVPEGWQDVAFRDLLTEGAYRVSATRRAGRTVWVRIIAGVDRTLRLLDPFGGGPFTVDGPQIRRDGRLMVCELRKGQAITLSLDETSEA